MGFRAEVCRRTVVELAVTHCAGVISFLAISDCEKIP